MFAVIVFVPNPPKPLDPMLFPSAEFVKPKPDVEPKVDEVPNPDEPRPPAVAAKPVVVLPNGVGLLAPKERPPNAEVFPFKEDVFPKPKPLDIAGTDTPAEKYKRSLKK